MTKFWFGYWILADKGIAMAAIIFASLGSDGSVWSSSSFWIPLVACIGGIIVFIGLGIEKGAKDERRKNTGWNILMFGILVEIATAGVLTIRGEREIRKINEAVGRNDLTNQRILDMSASVRFRVDKGDFTELPMFGNPKRLADLWLIEPPDTNITIAINGPLDAGGGKLDEKEWALFAPSVLPILGTADVKSFPELGGRTYVMQFHFDEDWVLFDGINRFEKRVNELNRVNVLRISVKSIPHDIEILDGSVKLVINDTVLKTFKIPRQKDNRPKNESVDTYSNTTPFVILAYLTNSPSGQRH